MDELKELLHEGMASAYRTFLEEIISQKFQKLKVANHKKVSKHLVEHILNGNKEPFTWESKGTKNIKLTFTKSELKKLDKLAEDYMPVLTAITSELWLTCLKKNWAAEQRHQIKDIVGFRKRLEERWGKPLSQLRLLLTIAREWGQETYNRNFQLTGNKKRLNDILLRLHIRACQVTDEVICLLENGFADGAMARWRTLHEIGVVSAFIFKYRDDDIVDRYFDYQAVASKRALNKYIECHEQLGYKPMPKRQIKKIENDYKVAMEKYGRDFTKEYGWASKHLNKARPIFFDIEKDVGYGEMRSYYSMSSDNVHAGNVKSMFFRLGLPENYNGFLAGRSNAGLMEPGQNTAHSLTRICITTCLSEDFAEDVVIGQMMKKLRDEIPLLFHDAHKRLEEDNAKLRHT